MFFERLRKSGIGIEIESLHEERGSDDEADREHENRKGWVPRDWDGTGNRFRSLPNKTNRNGSQTKSQTKKSVSKRNRVKIKQFLLTIVETKTKKKDFLSASDRGL